MYNGAWLQCNSELGHPQDPGQLQCSLLPGYSITELAYKTQKCEKLALGYHQILFLGHR